MCEMPLLSFHINLERESDCMEHIEKFNHASPSKCDVPSEKLPRQSCEVNQRTKR